MYVYVYYSSANKRNAFNFTGQSYDNYAVERSTAMNSAMNTDRMIVCAIHDTNFLLEIETTYPNEI